MSDSATDGNEPAREKTRHAQGVRYSLKEMLAEVKMERKLSVMGRELLDATEIEKMFADQRRRKKRRKV